MRHRIRYAKIAAALALFLTAAGTAAFSASPWDSVDNRIKPNVYQLNVAIKVKLKDGLYAQLTDLSPRLKYPVFSTESKDQGFRVIGHGTCFPTQTQKNDKTYLLTNKHVVNFGSGMVQECQRFFTGLRLYADRSAGFSNADLRYKDLLRIVNLGTKKDLSSAEKSMYQATVDTIWDTYDEHLSLKADPKRTEFNKHLLRTGLQGSIGLFVHAPGTSAQPPIVAELYKEPKSPSEPDLAILTVKQAVPTLVLETKAPIAGQPIQAAGYPVSAKATQKSADLYSPSFALGKITKISPTLIHFDAGVSKGDSGGPLLSQKGTVLGVVSRRAMPDIGTDRFAGAISSDAVRAFAPELFGSVKR